MKIAIHYDSKCTGSKELRMDNIKNVFQAIRDRTRTAIGDYAFAYDSAGKSKEPIFDGYLAGISLLPDETFNTSFHYVPTKYNDAPRPSKMESGLSTSLLEGSFARHQLPIDYGTATHVFLLGPMTQHAVEYVNTVQGNVIFHVQGDVGTTSYPDAMTMHKNLFPAPFNQWTGEECSRLIRSKMNASFSVKCKPDIVQEDVEVLNNVGPMEPLTVKIPSIYVQLRNYMVKACLCGEVISSPFQPIYISTIFQDMIDKDNSVSCWMLLKHSLTVPILSLIGRRVYQAEQATFKDYTFTFQEGKNGDVHFPAVAVSSQVFDEKETMIHHHRMTNKFHALLTGLEYGYGVISEKDIVDGLGDESESERAPFYEPFIVNI
jgi:hypothetical protein